jgi:hypothetical protein
MCLTKHHAKKTYWENKGIAPRILDLGTRWKWVVSFTPRPLYSQRKRPWYPLHRPEPLWTRWWRNKFPASAGNRTLEPRSSQKYKSAFIMRSLQQCVVVTLYEGVSKNFRTGRLERELQMVQLSATRCSCIAILWVSLVSFAAITLCVASQWVFVVVVVVVVCFVIDSVRKLLDIPSYVSANHQFEHPSS